MNNATHWYADPQALQTLPPLYRVLGLYYRRCADHATGDAPRGRYWHHKLARLVERLRLKDTARVRLRDLTVDVDLLDARFTWVMDEMLQPAAEARVVRSLLQPGDTFLDVGANHGSYSLLAAPAVRDGRVIAFEPQPRLARLLKNSFAANGFAHAQVHEFACGDHEGDATFYVPRMMSGVGGLYEDFSGGPGRRRFNVRVRRLDDLLAGQHLPGRVLMKLDVEGSELPVLRGAAAFLRARQPLILLELNPASARGAGYAVDDLLAFLQGLGYDRFAESADFPSTTPLDSTDTQSQRNVFVVPPSSSEPGRWDLGRAATASMAGGE